MGNTANARALFERALAEVTGEASAPLWDRFLQVRPLSFRGAVPTDSRHATAANGAVVPTCSTVAPALACVACGAADMPCRVRS